MTSKRKSGADDVLSVKEIAEMFGVQPETVYRWRSNDSAFPEIVVAGSRSWGLRRTDAEAFLLVKMSDSAGERLGRKRE